MNKDKVIKDLKERNNSLNNQFRLRDIRVNCLEHQNIEKEKEIERLHSIIKEVREYINNTWRDLTHEEGYQLSRTWYAKDILEILDKGE